LTGNRAKEGINIDKAKPAESTLSGAALSILDGVAALDGTSATHGGTRVTTGRRGGWATTVSGGRVTTISRGCTVGAGDDTGNSDGEEGRKSDEFGVHVCSKESECGLDLNSSEDVDD
jgi:hypothetical protein